MNGISFNLLTHGIAKLILRKTRAECVKQILIFASFLANSTEIQNTIKIG
jgi:hypothetical protein